MRVVSTGRSCCCRVQQVRLSPADDHEIKNKFLDFPSMKILYDLEVYRISSLCNITLSTRVTANEKLENLFLLRKADIQSRLAGNKRPT